MSEKCTLCTPGRDMDGFANVCLCENAGGVLNGYVCDGDGNLTTLTEIRAAADLLARVRAGCEVDEVVSWEGNQSMLMIIGPAAPLRELAEALKPN